MVREQYNAIDTSDVYKALNSTEAYSQILAPKSLHHRYLNEDLVYGLVPLENMAIKFGLSVPI